MTDKQFRRLNKTEMLEIIHSQELEISQLNEELQKLQAQLNERTVILQESGSIAEASLKLSKVFEAAQAAADRYLESVKVNAKANAVNAPRERQESTGKRRGKKKKKTREGIRCGG